jgi:hypothetical protein
MEVLEEGLDGSRSRVCKRMARLWMDGRPTFHNFFDRPALSPKKKQWTGAP